MKRWMIFLIVLAIIISIVFIAIGIVNIKDNGNNELETWKNQDNEIIRDVVKEEDPETGEINENVAGGGGSNVESGSVGSSGGAEGIGGNENNPETTPERELPSDLYTRPCGNYFLEYEVCAGICPDGQCLIDGKSCYCQIR